MPRYTSYEVNYRQLLYQGDVAYLSKTKVKVFDRDNYISMSTYIHMKLQNVLHRRRKISKVRGAVWLGGIMMNVLSITIAKSFIDAYVSVTIQLPSSVQYGTNERRAVINRKMMRRGQGIIKSDRGLIRGRRCGVKRENGEARSGSKLRVPRGLIRFKPHKTIRQMLCKPKDPIPDLQQSGIVL